MRFANRPRACHNAGVIRSRGPSVGTALGAAIALVTSTLGPSVHLHVGHDGGSRAVLHRHLPSGDESAPVAAMDHADRGSAEDVESVFVTSRAPGPAPARPALGGFPAVAPAAAAWTPMPADRGDRPIHGPPRADTRLRAPPLPAQRSR